MKGAYTHISMMDNPTAHAKMPPFLWLLPIPELLKSFLGKNYS